MGTSKNVLTSFPKDYSTAVSLHTQIHEQIEAIYYYFKLATIKQKVLCILDKRSLFRFTNDMIA